jgi:hypothetical protein
MTARRLVLKDAGVDAADSRLLRWVFDLHEADQPIVQVAVRSLRAGTVTDLQQLGPLTERDWPSETCQAVADRIGEELTRARLVSALGGNTGRRAR